MGFDDIWQRAKELEFSYAEPTPFCPFAQRFSAWARELCIGLGDEASVVAVNQAKLLLVDKYFEWRSVVPKTHRNRLGTNGHQCIFSVFLETYEFLRAVELSLTPPMLFLPEPPQVNGIFIGEIEDE